MIKGSGTIISTTDEEGNDLPFLTTDQILEQLEKFGFIVIYDVKSNLPETVLSYIAQLYNLGYDKITKILVDFIGENGQTITKHLTIVMKSTEHNDDLLTYNTRISYKKFAEKLARNTIMNVTDEPDTVWDWVKYMFNIEDILEENLDPTDDFETDTGVESGTGFPFDTGNLTPYTGEDEEPSNSDNTEEPSEDTSQEG